MKKFLIVIGSLFVLFLAAIVVIPMVVDVDQYRPKILKQANEKLNGKLELGKLQLSLWGTIRVKIEGLDLTDVKGQKVVSVKDAFVTVPWTSIFSGSPILTFNMRDPEVRVVKDVSGKLNVMTLLKEATATAETNPTATPGATNDGSIELPSMVTNARLGVDVKNAFLSYKDEATNSETVSKNLNLRVQDLSLSRKSEIELSGLLESTAENMFKVSGPFVIVMHATPHVENGEFQGLAGDLAANFDDIEIQAAQAFHKKKGMKAQFSGAIVLNKEILTVSKLEAKFFNAEVEMTGKVVDLQTKPSVDFIVKSNTIPLQPWNELIPMLKDYSLSGSASFDAKLNGLTEKLQYAADFIVKDLKAKSPMLKSEPVVNVTVKVVTDKVENFTATMKAPGNDVNIQGSVVSFTQPKVDLKISSNSLDLDQLINLPPPAAKGDAKAGSPPVSANGKVSAAEDLDAMLDPLRKNAVVKAMTLVAAVNAKMIQFYGVKMTEVAAKLSMRSLTFFVDSANLKLWGGTVGLKASTAMMPKTPTYQFSSNVSGLELQQAVKSQFQLMKDTILGNVNFKIEGSGSSYNSEAAKRNLNAKGSLKIVDATFESIDIGKMAIDAVNKALDKIADKIPAAKGKSIKSLPEGNSKYEFLAGDFTISGGRFYAPNFTAKAQKDRGMDLRGATEVGLIDQELKADWEVIDTYNMTKARDVGFDISGFHIDSALAEGTNPVTIPITVGCKYTAPCPSYGKVPEHFLKVAFANTKKGATQAVKNEVKEKAVEKGKKLLKGLFH